jgi:hypothetical protein
LILTAPITWSARQAAALNATSRITLAENGGMVTLRVTTACPAKNTIANAIFASIVFDEPYSFRGMTIDQEMKATSVIPGRAKGASPESITPDQGYGFQACALRRIPE